VLHIHNTFPLLSPAVFSAVEGNCTAIVFTLHNFRMLCANALFLRDGQACTICRDRRTVWPALRHACYRGSRAATLPLAFMIALHRNRRTLERHVDAFIALTEFQKEQFVSAGWPENRIYIKPNFRPNPPQALAWDKRTDQVVYIGRMSAEKGLDVLIDVWSSWGAEAPKLLLLGDGRERVRLERRVTDLRLGQKIQFTGHLSYLDAQSVLAKSRLMVFPTRCFEGFPMVVAEAMALGVPIIASSIGSLCCLVEEGRNGCLVPDDTPDQWLSVLRSVWGDSERLARMSLKARALFDDRYTENANYSRLMEIYAAAMENRRRRTQPR